MKKTIILILVLICTLPVFSQKDLDSSLPTLPPMPEIPEKLPKASVPMGSVDQFQEVQLDIPIAAGPFKPTWESIEENYPGTPQWLRDAKFGIWVHYGPQAAGESNDWYAQRLYNENDNTAYPNHQRLYGHPSEVGYKDVLHRWNPAKLNPKYLTKLYKKAGARFLMIQGVHHDNFDLWNSRYQPWNSVNIGPHRDLLREWVNACKKYDMRYGVTFHHEYTWWWWQTAFGCDSKGPKAGVPYDGNLTLADGKGKWWEGYDPRRLYGIDLREYKTVGTQFIPDPGIYTRHLDYCKWYATQWALRIIDVAANYDPDFIYTDGTTQGPFVGDGTGTGYKCNAMPLVMADFYNRVLKKRGQVDAFSVVKFRAPTNGTVTTAEFAFSDDINTSQPWIREAPVGGWYWAPGFIYDATSIIRYVVESVSRDGNCAVNIPIRPDGSLDDNCEEMMEDIGRWMKVNGEGIYGSHAWKILGEGTTDENGHLIRLPGGAFDQTQVDFHFSPQDIRFTLGKNGAIYAFCMAAPQPQQVIRIQSLGTAAGLKDNIRKVKLLGHRGKIKWQVTDEALEITCPKSLPFNSVISFRIE